MAPYVKDVKDEKTQWFCHQLVSSATISLEQSCQEESKQALYFTDNAQAKPAAMPKENQSYG